MKAWNRKTWHTITRNERTNDNSNNNNNSIRTFQKRIQTMAVTESKGSKGKVGCSSRVINLITISPAQQICKCDSFPFSSASVSLLDYVGDHSSAGEDKLAEGINNAIRQGMLLLTFEASYDLVGKK